MPAAVTTVGTCRPSGDMPDEDSQQESFSLANMVPQAPKLNRGVWEGIERAVRRMAGRQGELYVVTGPIFQGSELQTAGTCWCRATCSRQCSIPARVWRRPMWRRMWTTRLGRWLPCSNWPT